MENRRFGNDTVKKNLKNVKRFGGRVVKTLRCGRRISGSNPGRGMIFFFQKIKHGLKTNMLYSFLLLLVLHNSSSSSASFLSLPCCHTTFLLLVWESALHVVFVGLSILHFYQGSVSSILHSSVRIYSIHPVTNFLHAVLHACRCVCGVCHVTDLV